MTTKDIDREGAQELNLFEKRPWLFWLIVVTAGLVALFGVVATAQNGSNDTSQAAKSQTFHATEKIDASEGGDYSLYKLGHRPNDENPEVSMVAFSSSEEQAPNRLTHVISLSNGCDVTDSSVVPPGGSVIIEEDELVTNADGIVEVLVPALTEIRMLNTVGKIEVGVQDTNLYLIKPLDWNESNEHIDAIIETFLAHNWCHYGNG